MTHPTDDEIMELAGSWFHTGENQKRDDGYYYRSLGTPSNVRGSDLIEFARALLAEQARTEPDSFTLLARVRDALPVPERGSPLEQLWAAAMADPGSVPEYVRASLAQTHKAEDAPTLLEAFKSGKAILIDWPMEPVTPQEALKLMGMMDAEHAKTMGKPAPDREMAVCMQRVQHMACDLWASQKEVIRSHFVELAVAQSSARAEDAPSDEFADIAAAMDKVTPQSAQENADLRNVIQAACIDGLPGLARAWAKYFPDHPITIKGIEPTHTTGHCAEHAKPGGCQLHNLHCGWPDCDRRAAIAQERKA